MARRFAALGATVVDTDAISRQLTAHGGGAIDRLRTEFGPEFIDANGALNRDRMRALVFTDPTAKKRLESILHPMIRAQSEREIALAAGPYVIFDVPLLIESGTYRERCDRILVVDVPEEVQIERVLARDQRSRDQISAIIAAQIPRTLRLAAADDVIDNAGPDGALDARVATLHREYLAVALAKRAGKSGPGGGTLV